jgi:hypothetical protein
MDGSPVWQSRGLGYTRSVRKARTSSGAGRRSAAYTDRDGRATDDPVRAVRGQVLEYDARGVPVRRTRFFLDEGELPWLRVSEPAFLLWVLAALFVIWLVIGFAIYLT